MSRKRFISLIAAGALSAALVGCTTGGSVAKPALTVAEAKAAVLAEEKRIASVLPSKFVERHEQLDSTYLMSCRGGEYTWPDQGMLVLKGDPDVSALLAMVVASYENRPGFSAGLEKAGDGTDRVAISEESGANYYLSPTDEGPGIHLDSFSACFKLGPDDWSGGKF